MAKKVRKSKKLEEEEDASFEFPVFDEFAFVTKEFEMIAPVALAGVIAVLLGILGWALLVANVYAAVPWVLGFLGIVASPFLIQRLRAKWHLYTKGDWAALIALEFFGWLAIWFVLLNISPPA